MFLFSSAASTFSRADVGGWRFFCFSIRSRVLWENFLALRQGVANSLAEVTRGLTKLLSRSLMVFH